MAKAKKDTPKDSPSPVKDAASAKPELSAARSSGFGAGFKRPASKKKAPGFQGFKRPARKRAHVQPFESLPTPKGAK